MSPRLTALLLAALAALAVGLGGKASGVLEGAEQRALAERFVLRGAESQHDVVVVAIDDQTFSDLQQQWPFPRSMHGRMVRALDKAGAREIVYDVQFTEPTKPREDNALFNAVKRAGNVLLATTESEADGSTNVFGGDDNVAAANAHVAAGNLPEAEGSVLARLPYRTGRLESLAVSAARLAGHRVPSLKDFPEGGAFIDFRGPPRTIRTVSFSDALAGHVDPDLFRGKIVVVGATAPSLQDLHPTPTDSKPMAGPEIQANAIWTMVHGLPLREGPDWLQILLVVGLALAAPLLRLRLRVLPALLAGLVAGVAFLVAAQVAFDDGVLLWVAAPLAALLTGIVTTLVASHLAESVARRRFARDNDLLEARVRERTQELESAQLEILQRLAGAAEWRDEDTGQHVNRIGALTQRLALAIGYPEHEAERLMHASTAHDIGKVAIPDAVLLKPGRLDDQERRVIQSHAAIGAAMLDGSRVPLLQQAEIIARTHHERWDGTGYPAGLSGDDIPLEGRICAVVDVFDALVSPRPYKDAWPLEEAIAEITAQSGKHFDPELVTAFLEIVRPAYAKLYPGLVVGPAGQREAVAGALA
jgi:response regulator RpfG family c-di-GMP phosphodiesterase